jgi:hypothetical protein
LVFKTNHAGDEVPGAVAHLVIDPAQIQADGTNAHQLNARKKTSATTSQTPEVVSMASSFIAHRVKAESTAVAVNKNPRRRKPTSGKTENEVKPKIKVVIGPLLLKRGNESGLWPSVPARENRSLLEAQPGHQPAQVRVLFS